MKKTTKRLTMIVAILLTLVLLTSSIVSTTLAKYVVSKDAKTTVGLEAFGLTVDVKANYTDAGTAVESNKNGDSVTLTYANLNLKPGDNIANAIEVAVYGTAKVNVKVSINVTVAYGGDKFVVTKSNFSSLTTDSKTCVPIAFTVNGAEATSSYNALAESAVAEEIEKKISGYTYADGVASKTFNIDNVTKQVTLDKATETINFGFKWDKGDNLLNNQISTWLANQTGTNKSTVSLTYTVTVEQV